jgi:hypothetical protein
MGTCERGLIHPTEMGTCERGLIHPTEMGARWIAEIHPTEMGMVDSGVELKHVQIHPPEWCLVVW